MRVRMMVVSIVLAAAATLLGLPKPAAAVDLCRCVDHDCRAQACLLPKS